MPKKRYRNSAARRFNKLLAANISVDKARELSRFTWIEICKMVPALKAIAPEIPNPPNTKKERVLLQARLRQGLTEHLSRKEPDQASYWRNPRDARRSSRDRSRSPNYWGPTHYNELSHHSNKDNEIRRSSSHQPYRQTCTKEVSRTSQPNYWEEAGPSQARSYETNRRIRSPSEGEPNWEPPHKITKDRQVDCDESKYWGRYRSPRTRARQKPTPVACSSKYSYECTQLENIHPDGALQLKVKNEMRAMKPFPDQPYNAQRMSSEGSASFNYWSEHSEPDRPSRSGLRNQTHPPQHASTYSYSEDKKFREDPRNYQKISWDNSVNLDYRESDRSSRNELRNEAHKMATICVEDSDEECRGPIYEPHTADEGDAHCDFSRSYRREPKSEKGSHQTQPSETRENLKNISNEKNDAEPINVGIRNVTAMTQKQMELVQQSINQAIVRIGVQGAGPKFSGTTFKNGWIDMLCENHKSRKWLEKKVPFLKPWPEASLSVIPEGELSKSFTLSILIPDKEGITVTTALELLRVQNSGLDTKNWKVCKVKKTYTGQIVRLHVDETSFKALKLISFKANLGMDKITFWIRSGPGIQGSTYIEGQNKDDKSCDVESLPKITARKRYRKRHRKVHPAESRTIDVKTEMIEVKESKSPPPVTWYPHIDQSFASSDWATW